MKLHYRIIGRLSVALIVILTVWAGLFYFALMDEVNDEVDDSLEDYSEVIITRKLAGERLPSHNNGSNNQYYLQEVSEVYADAHPHIVYTDSMVFIKEKNETEPARILSTIFEDDDDRYFLLTVSTPSIEKHDLILAIWYWIMFLYGALLLTILGINVWIYRQSMKPLYILLHWLDGYVLGKENRPLTNPTNITEFQKLNSALRRSTEANERIYEQQKQFIGNASHEMQTPLAICRGRLEMLMEDESLTETQLEELAKVYETLDHITKLNKSLWLISKIENGQYPESSDIDLTAPFIMSKAVIPGMIKKGHGKIINICSMMSELGRETVSAYAAAKGGLKMLTRNIASEYGEYNIQCNGIGPGYIATPQTAPLRERQADGSRHPFDSFIVAKTPAARWGTPEDLMGSVVFLASDASNFVNGQVLYVDGGILAYIGKQPK